MDAGSFGVRALPARTIIEIAHDRRKGESADQERRNNDSCKASPDINAKFGSNWCH